MSDDNDVGLTAALRSFGNLVRRQRQVSRWTFCALSEKTNIDITALSECETGVNSLTEVEREALCEFLGIGIDAFPKMLRNERRKATGANIQTAEQLRAAPVVDLGTYRETWQKTISPQAD